MTSFQLRQLLPLSAPVLFSDATYAKPTIRWLKGEFWDWFQKSRWDLGLSRWTRKNDCDNFARAYAQAAQDCHSLSVGNNSDALAVGEFWYHQAKGGAHAIIIAVTDRPGLTFIEPQTGGELTLTEQEFQSCFFVRF